MQAGVGGANGQRRTGIVRKSGSMKGGKGNYYYEEEERFK